MSCLFVLIGMEVGLLGTLYHLGSLPFLKTPGIDPAAWRHWLASTPPQDAVAAVLRLVATVAAWWLLASTGLYVAARLARVPAMVRAAEWTTPRGVRRLIDRAVALSLLASLASGTAAFAGAPSQASPLPLPVPLPIPTAAPLPQVAPTPKGPTLREGAAPPGPADRHTVQWGDNLWTIAADHLADAGIVRSNGRIAPYWREVVQANRSDLRSGNPDLIFPGETVVLPPST